MIAVVDYCKGNLQSVERGLRTVGGDAQITDDPDVIARADAIVLPGVGAFDDASTTMIETLQMQAIRQAIDQQKPFLGICLGQHLLFEEGQEGFQEGKPLPKGLGVLPGVVERIPEYDSEGNRYKIPHVGWNSLEFHEQDCPLLSNIDPGEYFYFTHSYRAPDSSYTVATTTHSVTFPSVVQKGETVFGVQFHPEKSSDAGLCVLKNFVSLV